jgi:hypothetical protein
MLTWSRRDLLKAVPLAAARPAIAKTAEIPKLSDAAQLFIDFDQVDSVDNVVRTFHQAEKHPSNPVLGKEKPWEHDRGTWGSVIYDDEARLFKAWYGGESGRPIPNAGGPRNVMCYATSQDGVHWDRPKLGLCEVMGTRENNVVIGDDHHDGMGHWESTLKDPLDPDPQRRYKALGWSSYDWDGPMSGIYTMASPDGLRWTHTPEPVFHFHPRPNTQDLGPVGDAQAMTKLFLFTGSTLKLNAKANFGQVVVEALDEKGTLAPGLTRERCEPMQADSVEHPIRWKDASLADLRGKPIRLRFYLTNARLYSYRVTA